MVWLLFGLYGIYYGLPEGTARALIGDLVPQPQHGTAYGLYHASVGITALPAPLIPGFGPSAPFIFGALMAGTAWILFLTQVR